MTEPLRFSRLKLMSKSAAHFADGAEPDETPSMRKGTALHSYLLGDKSKVVVAPMRRDERSKVYQEFLAENEGKEILTAKELESVEGMRASIERHTRAMELLEGTREETYLFDWLGHRCRATPDVHTDRRIVELKTTRSSDLRKFPFQARSLYYHGQIAFYANALETLELASFNEYCIVAVESTRPFPVTVFNLTYELVEQGLRTCRLWMERLNVCERYNIWPAYADSDVTLDVADNELDLDLSGLEDVEAAE